MMEKPWDIKTLILSVDNDEGIDDFITFQVFSDEYFFIYEGDQSGIVEPKWCFEELDLDAARRLRDFLVYAVPGEVSTD